MSPEFDYCEQKNHCELGRGSGLLSGTNGVAFRKWQRDAELLHPFSLCSLAREMTFRRMRQMTELFVPLNEFSSPDLD